MTTQEKICNHLFKNYVPGNRDDFFSNEKLSKITFFKCPAPKVVCNSLLKQGIHGYDKIALEKMTLLKCPIPATICDNVLYEYKQKSLWNFFKYTLKNIKLFECKIPKTICTDLFDKLTSEYYYDEDGESILEEMKFFECSNREITCSNLIEKFEKGDLTDAMLDIFIENECINKFELDSTNINSDL